MSNLYKLLLFTYIFAVICDRLNAAGDGAGEEGNGTYIALSEYNKEVPFSIDVEKSNSKNKQTNATGSHLNTAEAKTTNNDNALSAYLLLHTNDNNQGIIQQFSPVVSNNIPKHEGKNSKVDNDDKTISNNELTSRKKLVQANNRTISAPAASGTGTEIETLTPSHSNQTKDVLYTDAYFPVDCTTASSENFSSDVSLEKKSKNQINLMRLQKTETDDYTVESTEQVPRSSLENTKIWLPKGNKAEVVEVNSIDSPFSAINGSVAAQNIEAASFLSHGEHEFTWQPRRMSSINSTEYTTLNLPLRTKRKKNQSSNQSMSNENIFSTSATLLSLKPALQQKSLIKKLVSPSNETVITSNFQKNSVVGKNSQEFKQQLMLNAREQQLQIVKPQLTEDIVNILKNAQMHLSNNSTSKGEGQTEDETEITIHFSHEMQAATTASNIKQTKQLKLEKFWEVTTATAYEAQNTTTTMTTPLELYNQNINATTISKAVESNVKIKSAIANIISSSTSSNFLPAMPTSSSSSVPYITKTSASITSSIPSSTATATTPAWPVKHASITEGDVILGGLMMVHSREDSRTCGPIMPQGGIQALEAMLYTLDQVNKQQLLPNITLGAHILDDCDKDTYGLEMAVDFIKGM